METNICKIKFRRGQDKQRLAIIPEEGEPIFTTDTKRFAIGDGETKGGIPFTQTYITSGDIPSGVVAGDIIYKPDNDSNGVYIIDEKGNSNCIGGTQLLQTNMPISLSDNKITLSYDSNFTLTENNSALTFDVVQAKKTLDIPTINDNILECKTNINTLSNIRLDYSIAPLVRYSAIHNINGIEITPIPVDGLELVNNIIEDTSNDFNKSKYPYIKTWNTNTETGSSLRYGISENLAYDDCFELKTSNITVLTSIALTSTPISTSTTIEKVSTDINGNEVKFNEETVLWSDNVSAFCGVGEITVSALSLKNGSITEDKLSNTVINKLNEHPSSVDTAMLVDGCVTIDKIANNSIDETKLSTDLQSKLGNIELDYKRSIYVINTTLSSTSALAEDIKTNIYGRYSSGILCVNVIYPQPLADDQNRWWGVRIRDILDENAIKDSDKYIDKCIPIGMSYKIGNVVHSAGGSIQLPVVSSNLETFDVGFLVSNPSMYGSDYDVLNFNAWWSYTFIPYKTTYKVPTTFETT